MYMHKYKNSNYCNITFRHNSSELTSFILKLPKSALIFFSNSWRGSIT